MEQKKKEIKIIKTMFINMLLKKGKKFIAEKLFYKILITLKLKTKQKAEYILIETINELSPALKLIKVSMGRKKRKKTNQNFVIFLTNLKQIKLSIFWLLQSRKIQSKNFIENICNEIIQTFKKKSKSLEKKKEMYLEIKKYKNFINLK